jgi:dATP pyrophosphohydrolase
VNISSNLIEAHIFRELNGTIEFLLLKRSPVQYYPNLWQMVSGKIKQEEKAFETALREIKEETGLTPLNLWVVPNVNSFYTSDSDTLNLVPVFASRVNNKSDVTLSNEHVDYKWLSPEDAKKHLAWAGQHKSVDIIADYFSFRKSFWALVEVKI